MRTLPVYLVILLVLGALGGWAWISHAPDDPRVVAAEEWPVVGPVVLWLREAYRPPDRLPVGGTTTERPAADRRADRRVGDPVVEPPPGLGSVGTVWVPSGTVLRDAPTAEGEIRALFGGITRLPLLERRGAWAKVWSRGREGWVHLPGYDFDGSGPPWGTEAEPPRPVEPEPPTERMLRAVTRHLGDEWSATTLGPYAARTDVDDDALLAYLDRLAHQVEPAWVSRHGVEPVGEPAATVVLFRNEGDFRLLQGMMDEIRDLHPEGFTARGLVALYTGDKRFHEVGSTLVHEIAHRIQRRALGPALPPWLEEGLADDLALSEIHGRGEIDVSRLGGAVTRFETEGERHTRVEGGQASLWNLRRALEDDRLPTLGELIATESGDFARGDDGRLHYDLAALWVRYLVQGDDGRHRAGWHDFLRAVSEGEPITPDLLLRSLGETADDLEARFRQWIRQRSNVFFS